MFDVFEQLALLFNSALASRFDGFGAFHHLGSHVADMALVGGANLALLDGVGPVGAALGSLAEMANLLLQTRVLCFFMRLAPCNVLLPGRIITAEHACLTAPEGQNMVDAAIEKMPVVRNEDKTALSAQIACQ